MPNPISRLTEAKIRDLPLASGIWRDESVPGFFVICHKTTRSYCVQTDLRRNGRHVKTIRRRIGRCDRMGLAAARREAKQLLGQIQSGVDVTARPDETGITIKQALEAHLKDRTLRPRTAEAYREHVDRYLFRFKNRAVADIGRQDVRELHDLLIEKHGRCACASGLRTLRALINTAMRVDPTITMSPINAVRIPVPGRRKVAPLDLKAWYAKVSRQTPVMRDLHLTFLLTAARRSSVLNVKREDVTLGERPTIFFRWLKTSDDGLTVPIGPWLAEVLRRRMEDDEPLGSPWLFPSCSKLGHIREPKRNGLPSPHTLRHVARSLLLASGAPYAESAILCGHSLGGGATERYVNPMMLIESLRPWAERYERYILAEIGIAMDQPDT